MAKDVFVLKTVFVKNDKDLDSGGIVEIGDSSSVILGSQYHILKIHPSEDMNIDLSSYVFDHLELFEDKNSNFIPLFYIKDEEGNIEPLSVFCKRNFHRKVLAYYITCNGNTIEKILPTTLSEEGICNVIKYIKEEFFDFRD